MIKKLTIIHLFLLLTTSCINKINKPNSKSKNINIISQEKESGFEIKNFDLFYNTQNIFNENKEILNLEKPKNPINYNDLKTNSKPNFSPSFKIGIEDQSRQRLPFEEPIEKTIISRKATLELGFKTKEDLELFLKSNFAHITYDTLNAQDRLNIQLNQELENISAGITLSF